MHMALASRLAWATQSDYASAIRHLQRQAEPADPTAAVVMPANDQVREWFIRNQIPVSDR